MQMVSSDAGAVVDVLPSRGVHATGLSVHEGVEVVAVVAIVKCWRLGPSGARGCGFGGNASRSACATAATEAESTVTNLATRRHPD